MQSGIIVKRLNPADQGLHGPKAPEQAGRAVGIALAPAQGVARSRNAPARPSTPSLAGCVPSTDPSWASKAIKEVPNTFPEATNTEITQAIEDANTASPNAADTEGDGPPDAAEAALGSNPNPGDTHRDGLMTRWRMNEEPKQPMLIPMTMASPTVKRPPARPTPHALTPTTTASRVIAIVHRSSNVF